MYLPLLLGLLLLSGCSSSTYGYRQTVVAAAGDVVFLPCSFSVSKTGSLGVEWSKEGLDRHVVLLYQDGCENHEMKNQTYKHRSSLDHAGLSDGVVSLRLSGVLPSDAGTYHCKRLRRNHKPHIVTSIKLVVVVRSEVSLSLVPADDGSSRIDLQCDTGCWMPEPTVTFLDNLGRHIITGEPKVQQDSNGCAGKRLFLNLQSATSSVTCRVHEPRFNVTREKTMFIPGDCLRSWTWTVVITVTVTAVICGLLFVVGLLLWREYCSSASVTGCEKTQRPDETSPRESQNPMKRPAETQRRGRISPDPSSAAPSPGSASGPPAGSTLEQASRTACPEGEEPHQPLETSPLIFSTSPSRRARKAGIQRSKVVRACPSTLSEISESAAAGGSQRSSSAPQDKPAKLDVQPGGRPRYPESGRPRINSSTGDRPGPRLVPPRSFSFSSTSPSVQGSRSDGSAEAPQYGKLAVLPVHNRYSPLTDLPE